MMQLIDKKKAIDAVNETEYSSYVDCLAVSEVLENVPTVEAIPKADYENRLKADLKAILVELQLEIEEKFNDRPFSYNHHQRTEFYHDIDEVIQQKINLLRSKD